MAVTTIPISKEFHDWLKSKGKKGESYEAVIKRLLNQEYKPEIEETSETGKIEVKIKKRTKAKHSKEEPKNPEAEQQAEPEAKQEAEPEAEQKAEPQVEEEGSTEESIKKRISEVFDAPEENKDEENKEHQDGDESASKEDEDSL